MCSLILSSLAERGSLGVVVLVVAGSVGVSGRNVLFSDAPETMDTSSSRGDIKGRRGLEG